MPPDCMRAHRPWQLGGMVRSMRLNGAGCMLLHHISDMSISRQLAYPSRQACRQGRGEPNVPVPVLMSLPIGWFKHMENDLHVIMQAHSKDVLEYAVSRGLHTCTGVRQDCVWGVSSVEISSWLAAWMHSDILHQYPISCRCAYAEITCIAPEL